MVTATGSHEAPRRRDFGLLKVSGLVWAFLLLCVVASLIAPSFLNSFNLINVIRQVALLASCPSG